jgi:phosphatidylinositol kinase/protein kinase (PI-3  family)
MKQLNHRPVSSCFTYVYYDIHCYFSDKLPKITHVAKIMKRIRSKLEGVDFGVQHRMSVSEQVSKTIEQATSADNLCLMYEGWTSWV